MTSYREQELDAPKVTQTSRLQRMKALIRERYVAFCIVSVVFLAASFLPRFPIVAPAITGAVAVPFAVTGLSYGCEKSKKRTNLIHAGFLILITGCMVLLATVLTEGSAAADGDSETPDCPKPEDGVDDAP